MYIGKRFQVEEWICNQQEYFWLEILLVSSSSSCNIIFDTEFRDLVFLVHVYLFYVEVGKYACYKYFDTFTNLRIN